MLAVEASPRHAVEANALLCEANSDCSASDLDAFEPRLSSMSAPFQPSWWPYAQSKRLRRTILALAALVSVGALRRCSWRGSTARADVQEAVAELAVVRRCSSMNEDCRHTSCCSHPGTLCYEKNPKWGQCRADCTPGLDPADHVRGVWSCKELGQRAPGPRPKPDLTLPPAPWVEANCSAGGEDCSSTGCCKESGKQCFTKCKGWASCKAECAAGGPDPVDPNRDPWECKALGMKTPGPPSGGGKPADWVASKCSDGYENCRETRCCQVPGYQCYKKTEVWSMCLPACTPGPLLTDADPVPWNCTPLGGRTPGIPKVQAVKVAEWVPDKCSKEGENCIKTMCCAEATKQCYQKDEGWAACYRGCVPSPDVNPYDPERSKWTCKKLGSRTPRAWKHPSLYCFHVYRISSYEAALVKQELETDGGIGIFACELYDVFAGDGEDWVGDGPLGKVRTHHFTAAPVGKSVDGTAANTELFINVWQAVKVVGKYKLTDWTVKVDPDAVVFPDRLRAQLGEHPGAHPKGQFIINCNKKWMTPMMFGSLEAISRKALENYFAKEKDHCQAHVYKWGEDRWLGSCLKKLGANGTEDFDLVGDDVCKGADCSDGKAAYHPFKDAKSWKQCFDKANRPRSRLLHTESQESHGSHGLTAG
mmetsp:Transcript_24902/g.57885  ORF Transcript_24902/g.57885 Transcript_24902/m.57885 type:complete len:649 (+) Transcript_24902:39-1985(+)